MTVKPLLQINQLLVVSITKYPLITYFSHKLVLCLSRALVKTCIAFYRVYENTFVIKTIQMIGIVFYDS